MNYRWRFVLVVVVTCSVVMTFALFAAKAQQLIRDVNINFIEVSRLSDVQSVVKAYITVTDLDGFPIKQLEAGSFVLFEDGVRVAQFEVQQASEALWIVLLMDTTTSMGTTGLAWAKDAAKQFIRSMPAQDYIALYEFQEETRLLSDFEQDHGKVHNAVDKLELVDRWTCLYDAIDTAVKKAMQVVQGRRAVVVMTDGRDDRAGRPCSKVSVDDVINLAYQHRVPVYTVGFGRKVDESVLRRIAQKTGGAYWSAPEPEDLTEVYRQIAELLRSQYVIRYETSAAVGNHYLVVEVNYQGQQKPDSENFVVPQPVATATPEPTSSQPPPATLIPPPTPYPGEHASVMVRVIENWRLLAIGFTVVVIIFSLWMLLRARYKPTYEAQRPSRDKKGNTITIDTDDTEEVAKFTVVKSVKMREGESLTIPRDKLQKGKVTIGRHEDNDIIIDDNPVSRYHARLQYEHGRVYLYDEDSTFGTRINDEKLTDKGRELHDGDLIQLGTKTVLRFNYLTTSGTGDISETGEETQDTDT